ncbi:uncharacterized protein VTP21DRAFT_7651 [Calcarisporiella thermophila]|uniref:uncharacterized protein n=1 Tax=Calcarisporiella thermophila TaxID=911321 RepID=UPI0037441B6C
MNSPDRHATSSIIWASSPYSSVKRRLLQFFRLNSPRSPYEQPDQTRDPRYRAHSTSKWVVEELPRPVIATDTWQVSETNFKNTNLSETSTPKAQTALTIEDLATPTMSAESRNPKVEIPSGIYGNSLLRNSNLSESFKKSLTTVRNGRIDTHRKKRKPLYHTRQKEVSKHNMRRLIQQFTPKSTHGVYFCGVEHTENSDLVNYAKQVLRVSSILASKPRTLDTSEKQQPKEVIIIEDDPVPTSSSISTPTSTSNSTPTPTSITISNPKRDMTSIRLKPTFNDSPASAKISANKRHEKSPGREYKEKERQLPKEPDWMREIRLKLERSLEIDTKQTETPTYSKLKGKEYLIDLEIEKSLEGSKGNNFPELTEKAKAKIHEALSQMSGYVAQKFNMQLTSKDIRTLTDGQWLNDEVINFYGNLIMDRAKKNPGYPKVHVFNTFFYSTLRDSGYPKVKRWTKRQKIDIFALDYVLIPIHLGMHWCCAVINLRRKRFEYYDSLHGSNPQCFQLLREYLDLEHKDKKGCIIDLSDWEDLQPKNIPGQRNGYDCGVFTCTFAEYVSREAPFDFDQRHMKYIRRRMIYEIVSCSLMERKPPSAHL